MQFGLQFKADQTSINENLHDRDEDLPAAVPEEDLEEDLEELAVPVDTGAASADVVVLDRFRKK